MFMLLAVAAYLLLALLSFNPADPGWSHTGERQAVHNFAGAFGAWFADLGLYLLGYMSYLFPVMVGYSGWLVFHSPIVDQEPEFSWSQLGLRWAGFFLVLLSGCGLGSFVPVEVGAIPNIGSGAGGVLGGLIGIHGLTGVFGSMGAKLLLLAVFVASFSLFTGLSWLALMDLIGRYTLLSADWLRGRVVWLVDYLHSRWLESRAKAKREVAFNSAVEKKKNNPRIVPKIQSVFKQPESSEREFKERQIPLFEPPADTELPPLNLLDVAKPVVGGYSEDSLEAMSRLVEHKLSDFNVSVEVVAVHPGPVVTRFELQTAPGVKVSQISNLSKDLARSLSVISVRIVEVIPGKSTVGLEIPNEQRELVALSDVLKSDDYEKATSPLVLALGKDIGGKPVVADISRMPHLLVAGTTGVR